MLCGFFVFVFFSLEEILYERDKLVALSKFKLVFWMHLVTSGEQS